MSYFLGLLLNEAVNWILKHIIRESRPLRGKNKTVQTFYLFDMAQRCLKIFCQNHNLGEIGH